MVGAEMLYIDKSHTCIGGKVLQQLTDRFQSAGRSSNSHYGKGPNICSFIHPRFLLRFNGRRCYFFSTLFFREDAGSIFFHFHRLFWFSVSTNFSRAGCLKLYLAIKVSASSRALVNCAKTGGLRM